VPLVSDVNESLREVPKVTSQLRHRFIDIYATYMGTYYVCMFMPYVFLNYFLMQQTIPYTMAFSNTPGLLKPIWYEGKRSIKMQYYFIPTGYVGMGLSSLSYVDYFKITLTTDDAIMKDPQTLLDLVEKNLRQCYRPEPVDSSDGSALRADEATRGL